MSESAEPGGATARALFFAVFAALAAFALGDVGLFDAGELASAAGGLGVAHPTGSPLFCVLGYAAGLLPVGPLPFRMALLSAAAVALATALIFETAREHGAHAWPAAAGALVFPAIYVVWLHGTRIEVYAVNAAMIALLVHLLFRRRPALGAAAFVTGLGLGAHATFVLSAAICWPVALIASRAWRRLPELLGWGLVGALVLAYLPVAAGRQPWLNWGDPSTPSALWAHLTAASIRGAYEGAMGALGPGAWERWVAAAGGPALGLLAAVGVAAAGWLERRAVLVAAFGILAGDALFSVLLNPMGQAELQTGVPGALAASLLGALAAGNAWGTHRRFRGELLAAAAVLLALTFALGERAGERYTARSVGGDWGRVALAEAGPGALLFVSTDHLASQALYLEGLEGYRTDVLTLVKQHLPDTRGTEARARALGERLPEGWAAGETGDGSTRLERLVRDALPRRPVAWELGDALLDGPYRQALRPTGLIYRLRPPASRDAAAPALAPILATLGRDEQPDERTRRLFSDAARHRGVWYLIRGELEAGAAALETAVALDDTNPPALANLAAARRRQGRLGEALPLLERAVTLAPDYRKGWQNLADYREAAGDREGAEAARRRAEAIPQWAR